MSGTETVKTAKELARWYMKKRTPCMTEGKPGIGKTAMWRQIAQEEGIGFIVVQLAQMDPVDLRGLPATRELKNHLLETTWARPEFLPQVERDGEEGIILFDELSDCGKMMQSASYQPILEGKVGPHIIAPGWYRCGAGNRQSDRAAAQAMSTALANRFAWIEIVEDIDCFREYGHKVGMSHFVLGFLKHRPALLHNMGDGALKAFASPRSWEEAAKYADAPAEIRTKLIRGCVGEGPASEFDVFMRTIDLPDLEEIVANPKGCRIPEQPSHKYALASMLAQCAKRDNFDKIMAYIKRSDFGRDFEICTVLDATKRDAMLCDCKAFTDFANRNQNFVV